EASRPGIHGLRIRTQSGISNLMTFHVGTLPEVAEAEPNSSREQAQEIGFGSVVNGVIQNEDVDYFAFTAKQGERISVEVEGLRLGRTFFDPVLLLYDPSGNLVASSDDLHVAKQDAGLSCLAPSEGRYVVELRETAYRGNNESTYR